MSYAKKILKLYYTSGSSDKEYHAVIEASADGTGFHVYGMNGRRGSARTKQTKTTAPVSLGTAESIYSGLVEEKRKKGYTSRPSGTPYGGISESDASVSGTPPAAPVPATPLVPLAWFQTANEAEFDDLLGDDAFAAQELVAGRRIMVEVTAGRVRGVDVAMTAGGPSAAPVAVPLPAPLTTELLTAAPGFVLDGLYDAATSRFAIVDGYRVNTGSPSVEGPAAPFKARMSLLVKQFAKAKGKHVEIMQPHLDEDKGALAYALQDHGRKQMMLRKVHSSYETGSSERSEASVLVHNF